MDNKQRINREKYRKIDYRCTIRFKEDEYKKIMKHSEKSGLNLQRILKNSYYDNYEEPNVIHIDDLRNLFTELSRIGANLNQIAKKFNTFDFGNIDNDMQILSREIPKLKDLISDKVCRLIK